MSPNQRNELLMLLASFGLAYCLFHYAGHLPLPVVIVGALLVIVILIRVSKNENVS